MISSSRSFATHRDLPTRSSSPYRSAPNASSWSTLTRPLIVTILVTGTTFSLAYHLDIQRGTGTSRSPETKLKVLTGLIAVNTAVFAACYIPSFTRLGRPIARFLSRYSTFDAIHVRKYPMSVLTSGFSHTEVWHLGLNMMGLYTVGSVVYDLLGTNQFLAFYTSAICWSGMAQLAVTVYRARRGILPRGSLGASGGIYALFGVVAWYVPNASVYLIFFPFVPIQLGLAFTGMMTMDAYGLYAGWKTFGHAAHFGGGMLGLLYSILQIPEKWLEQRRKKLVEWFARKLSN